MRSESGKLVAKVSANIAGQSFSCVHAAPQFVELVVHLDRRANGVLSILFSFVAVVLGNEQCHDTVTNELIQNDRMLEDRPCCSFGSPSWTHFELSQRKDAPDRAEANASREYDCIQKRGNRIATTDGSSETPYTHECVRNWIGCASTPCCPLSIR